MNSSKTEPRIAIASGGTGGHIYPGLAVADALRRLQPRVEILFFGSKRGLESSIIPAAGYKLQLVTVDYFYRRLTPRNLLTTGRLVVGTAQAMAHLKSFSPQVVLGTGGYVTGPVGLAAKVLRLPLVLQEQNAYPGITTRTLARFATVVFTGQPEAVGRLRRCPRVVYSGNPIREDFLRASRRDGISHFCLAEGIVTVLLTGGSQGAKRINDAVISVFDKLLACQKAQFVWLTGKREFARVQKEIRLGNTGTIPEEGIRTGNFRILPFTQKMPLAMAAADLLVGRAGAITLAEATALGLPLILVPYPYSAENHQEKNARALEAAGAAVVIRDSELDGVRLYQTILRLLEDPSRPRSMGEASKKRGKPGAAREIARQLLEIASRS